MNPEPLPAAPRRTALWLGLSVGLVALLAAAGAAVYALGHQTQPATASSPQPSASPSAAVTQLSEPAACNQLVPLLRDTATYIQAIVAHSDGSTVDWSKLDQTLVGLSALQPGVPEDMRSDVAATIGPLQHLHDLHAGSATNGDMDLENFRAAGLRLATACGAYAS